MVNNNLPPNAQPWARAVDALSDSTRSRIDGVTSNMQVQQQNISSALSLVPDRISELAAATSLLSIPISETRYELGATWSNATLPASTWNVVQEFTLQTPDPTKTYLELAVVSTMSLRLASWSFPTLLFRIVIDGVPFPQSGVAPNSTGFATAGMDRVAATSAFIRIEFWNEGTVTIGNSGTGPNAVCTYTSAVWSS